MDKRVMEKLGFHKVVAAAAEKTVTESGKCTSLRIEPVSTREEAERLLAETKEAESFILGAEKYPLMGFDEPGGAVARMRSGASLNCAELMRVGSVMKAARRAAVHIGRREGNPLLGEIAMGLIYDDGCVAEIDRAIESDDMVADGASAELARVRRRILAENDRIREKLSELIRSKEKSKYLQDAIITMRSGRYVVPVKQEYRSYVKGMVHGESGSGATVFIEPMAVVEANNTLALLAEEEKREIERVLAALSDMVRPYAESIVQDVAILSRLDVIFAKAAYAIATRSTPPVMSENDEIDIKNGRHPLISRNRVIPVSVKIGKETRTLIITGPNTGGKTVTLSLIGLFAMMAQSGMYIPADSESVLPVFKDIYADIGDEQSIEQSLSTFSAHMKNIVFIMRHAGEGSLALLDELGAGTDPEEGAALGLAILQELTDRGVRTFATTHYSEIKSYALSQTGFMNGGMEFDNENLAPTYKLIMGVTGASNAFYISKKLGLRGDVIERAKGFMDEERLTYNEMLKAAEQTARSAERELLRAKEAEQTAREAKKRAEERERKAEEQRQKLLQKAKDEARMIVKEAREETEALIKEARKLPGKSKPDQTRAAAEIRGKIEKRKKKLDPVKKARPKKQVTAAELAAGDDVYICSMGVEATVLEKPDTKGNAYVQAGIMKLYVNVNDLEKRGGAGGAQMVDTSRVRLAPRSVPLSIDIHGYTVDEAVLDVDKYLDDAAIAGLHEVMIVHGKGTGALRSGVQRFLRHNPHVESFRLGKYGEGEEGVTVVTLKGAK